MLGCKTTAIAAADISFARHPKDCKCEENISARRVGLVPTDHPSFGSILKLQNEIKKCSFLCCNPFSPSSRTAYLVFFTRKRIFAKSQQLWFYYFIISFEIRTCIPEHFSKTLIPVFVPLLMPPL